MDQVDRIPERVAVLEEIAKTISKTLERLEIRVDKIEAKMDTQFRWLIGIIITVSLAQAALIVRLTH